MIAPGEKTIQKWFHFPATTRWRKWKLKQPRDNRWQEAKISEVSPRVTPVWWVYGGHRFSGPPAQVQTAIAGTAVPSWHEPRPPRFLYHRPNGWRAPPISWGSPASRNSVPWSIQLSTNVPVSLSRLIFDFKFVSDAREILIFLKIHFMWNFRIKIETYTRINYL